MRLTLAGVLAYFEANLETTLVAMEAEYSVTITRLVTMETKENVAKQFPYMVILPQSGTNEYGDEEAPFTTPWKIRDVKVIVVHNNSNIVEVQNTLLYYEDAVNRMIEDDDTLGSRFNRVQLTEEDFSEMGQWMEQPRNYEQSVLKFSEQI